MNELRIAMASEAGREPSPAWAQELIEEIRAIRLLLERQARAPRRLSQPDHKALGALLPVIAAAIEARPFTIKELTAHSKLNIAPALKLREVLASATPRGLGQLFSRGAGCDVEGYVITALCGTRDGVRWRVQCDEGSSHKLATFAEVRRVRFNG